MAIYYSPTIKGFFDTEIIAYPRLPVDIIEVTELQRDEYVNGINMQQKELIFENGQLSLIDLIKIPDWWEIRLRRNRELAMSDFTQMPDYPGDKVAWATYRQVLRDIPQTYDAPEKVIWPEIPGE